jgi:methylated-DNA-protein-cysteine methyltransferase-like protein
VYKRLDYREPGVSREEQRHDKASRCAQRPDPLPSPMSRSLPPCDSGLQIIWDVVCRIPRGQVSTYGAVARAAGLPGRARQAGFALKVAPDEMNLPWHRVVGAGGRIVFPKTSRHYRQQVRLLRAEGVAIREGRVEPCAVVDPAP